MKDNTTTTLATARPDAAPPFLFSEETMQRVSDLMLTKQAAGEYTGERLRREAPRLVEAAIRLSALGCTQEEIAFALQVSENSVARLLLAEATSVENYKERISQDWREVTHLTVGAMRAKLQDPATVRKTSLKDLAVVAGIAAEKTELMMGGVTQRVGHVDEADQLDKFNKYIEGLKAAGMGLTPAHAGQKGAPPAGALIEVEGLPIGGRSDDVSDDSGATTRVNGGSDTVPDTVANGDTVPGSVTRGEGGVRGFSGGAGAALDTHPPHGDKADL